MSIKPPCHLHHHFPVMLLMGLSGEFSSPSSEAGLVLGCGPSCTAILSPSIREEEPFVLTLCVPGSGCSQEALPPALRVGAWTGVWEFLHQPSRPGSRGPGAGLCRLLLPQHLLATRPLSEHWGHHPAVAPPPCKTRGSISEKMEGPRGETGWQLERNALNLDLEAPKTEWLVPSMS